MELSIDTKTKHYKIDTFIKDTIKAKYGLDDKVAEAISLAIDMKDQDLSKYATKGDIAEVKHEIESLKQETKSDLEIAVESLRNEIKDSRVNMYKMHIASIIFLVGFISKMLGKW